MSRRHILLLCVLILTNVCSLVYAIREMGEANDLAYSRAQLRIKLASAESKIQTMASEPGPATETAATDSTEPPPIVRPLPAASNVRPLPRSTPIRRRQAVVRPSARPKVVEDPRWKRVESKLSEHQSQLADQRERIVETQQLVQKTGDQLDGKINSAREELNRSVATTHDEVVQLQKRGEHNIYEFDLAKSKQFQRVGPLSLLLRKADAKHRVYDLSVIVNDINLDKKHVNMFEPVWIHLSDQAQPIQLVVNKIDKNEVRGYISEPRYKTTELPGPSAPSTPQAPALKSR